MALPCTMPRMRTSEVVCVRDASVRRASPGATTVAGQFTSWHASCSSRAGAPRPVPRINPSSHAQQTNTAHHLFPMFPPPPPPCPALCRAAGAAQPPPRRACIRTACQCGGEAQPAEQPPGRCVKVKTRTCGMPSHEGQGPA
eukprot:358299-Chlamydomonas_euryale.AAC.9